LLVFVVLREMKASFVVLAVIAACAVAVDEIPFETLTHIVVGSGSTGAVYQWKQNTYGSAYAEACYGNTIYVYRKNTVDINPKTDKVWANFTADSPILVLTFQPNWYYGFFPVDLDNKGPNGINAAVDIIAAATEERMYELVPSTPGNVVNMKISADAKSATLTWSSTGVDNTTVYRKDVDAKEYSEGAWFPPHSYYMTGCSVQLWMNYDETATKAVQVQHSGEKCTGLVHIDGMEKKKVTLIAITTQKKVVDPFIRAYDVVALGAASSTIISSVALVLLLLSVLLI